MRSGEDELESFGNRILVVDDDRDNALVIRMILEHPSYKVDMFTDSALANFELQKYALALIDLRMAGLDSFGLYERILEMDGKIKDCFMSGYDYRDALSKFQTKHRTPAERCLQKPLNVDKFIGPCKKDGSFI